MRKKSKDSSFKPSVFGIIYETFKYFTMANMNTVKSTNSDNCVLLFVELGNALDCNHRDKIRKRLTFNALNSP